MTPTCTVVSGATKEATTWLQHVLDGIASSLGIDVPENLYAGRRVHLGGDRRSPTISRLLTLAGRPMRWPGSTRHLHRIKRSKPVQPLSLADQVPIEPTPTEKDLLAKIRGSSRDDVVTLAELIDRSDLPERLSFVGREI